MSDLVEIAPGRWRFVREAAPPARSSLPCPHVISDTMDATEQVDGRYYTSKAAFRAVGRQLGLTEVGDQKLPPKRRSTDSRQTASGRRDAIQQAVARYRNGERGPQDQDRRR
jgi:hypothetical protein